MGKAQIYVRRYAEAPTSSQRGAAARIIII